MPLTFARTTHRYGPYMHGQNLAAYYNPLSGRVNGTRLLFHSGLDTADKRIANYPFLPDETVNFTWDVLANRDVVFSKTLKSNVFAKYDQVKDDAIIKEIFRPDGGLAVTWEFFHRIERMFQQDPDVENGEFILWRPYDRNHKTYIVDIVSLLLNGEEWGPEFRGRTSTFVSDQIKAADGTPTFQVQQNQERWAINEFQIWLRIRSEELPQANLFAVGGSDTGEPELFNVNEIP